MEDITGKTLIDMGYTPGRWFAQAIEAANATAARGGDADAIRQAIEEKRPPPTIPLRGVGSIPYHENIEADGEDEEENVAKVRETMIELARTPTLEAVAAMPDACPTGAKGVIPVGGIAAAKGAIHPGMHSADICCSMAITVIGDVDPKIVLDAGSAITHFGGGGRGPGNPVKPSADLLARFESNPFLGENAIPAARDHFATQGDGNHFYYVGRLRSTGETALVTHHGSRKPGAMLYKRGMAVAEKLRRERAPEVLKANAWIDFDSRDGEDYWAALQIIRDWTKANHFALHDMTLEAIGAKGKGRFWNEHNFVFRRGNTFYHGKGATPAWKDFASDSSGQVLIPLNMGAPILIAEGTDNPSGLGFAPHGAGRNMSRSEHKRRNADKTPDQLMAEETAGLDIRFHCGVPDASELPSAYKSAPEIERQIDKFGLAKIVDRVDPYGSIMAGDWLPAFHAKRMARKAADREN